MKKLLAFLLALTLLLSLGVTAFADTYEEGINNTQSRTQTITVNAPALTWTLEIPASLELEFGNTDLIKMGNLKISDVSWTTLPASNFIFVNMRVKKCLAVSSNQGKTETLRQLTIRVQNIDGLIYISRFLRQVGRWLFPVKNIRERLHIAPNTGHGFSITVFLYRPPTRKETTT